MVGQWRSIIWEQINGKGKLATLFVTSSKAIPTWPDLFLNLQETPQKHAFVCGNHFFLVSGAGLRFLVRLNIGGWGLELSQ
jgi:hypothetical protein